MKIARRCRQCDQVYIFDVKSDDYIKYLNGLAVRKAFPYLSSAERELFITRICGLCFDKMFPN